MADSLLTILKTCATILEKFDPIQPTPLTDFIAILFKEEKINLSLEQSHQVLTITEACLKHAKILDGIIRPFCRDTKKTILRRDYRLFEVLAYFLLVLRKSYSNAIIQAVLGKVYSFSVRRFLLFFSGVAQDGGKVTVSKTNSQQDNQSRAPMHTIVRKTWYANFDRDYVDTHFYGPYCQYESELRGIVSTVEATYRNEPIPRVHRTTLTQPFTFKTPDRKVASETRLLSRQTPLEAKRQVSPDFTAKEIPSTTYVPSEGTVRLQVKARERTEKIRNFKTRIDQRELVRKKTQRSPLEGEKKVSRQSTHLFAQVREQEMAAMKPPPPKPVVKVRKAIHFKEPQLPVKQTAAAVLREKALFEKHKEAEQRKTEESAAGYWDSADYEKRLRKLEEKDLETAIVENERKIINAMQSLEKAIAAKKAYDEETKLKAVSEKELKKGFREKRRLEIDQEITLLRGAVEQAQLISKVQLVEGKRRALQQKHAQAQLVKEENNELYHRYQDQCEEELARRKAIIAQIQEMEARITTYGRTFDFGSVREFGNLTDLSLADLQDRLIALRFETMENLAKQRERILDEKEVVKVSLKEAKEFVAKERPQWAEEKRVYVEKARKLKELRESAHYLPHVIEVRKNVMEKSQERRKQRVTARESLLKIHDSAWDRYVFV